MDVAILCCNLSNKVCIPKETEDLNLCIFNRITGINESKTLTKHLSCECKCRFDGKKCNLNQWQNNDKCRCECSCMWKRWNPSKCLCENGKYLASIIDDSTIIWNEVIKSNEEEIRTISTNFNEKEVTCKTQNFYTLLITVSIYW